MNFEDKSKESWQKSFEVVAAGAARAQTTPVIVVLEQWSAHRLVFKVDGLTVRLLLGSDYGPLFVTVGWATRPPKYVWRYARALVSYVMESMGIAHVVFYARNVTAANLVMTVFEGAERLGSFPSNDCYVLGYAGGNAVLNFVPEEAVPPLERVTKAAKTAKRMGLDDSTILSATEMGLII